jgi:hypothetical protein
VAFAIECFENGILTEADTGASGSLGRRKSIVALVEKIIARDGIAKSSGRGQEGGGSGSERARKSTRSTREARASHARSEDRPCPRRHLQRRSHAGTPHDQRGMYYSSSFLWRNVSWAPRLRKHLRSDDYVPS